MSAALDRLWEVAEAQGIVPVPISMLPARLADFAARWMVPGVFGCEHGDPDGPRFVVGGFAGNWCGRCRRSPPINTCSLCGTTLRPDVEAQRWVAVKGNFTGFFTICPDCEEEQ